MRHVPMPLEWHPAYADATWLLDFVTHGAKDAPVVLMPKRSRSIVAELVDGPPEILGPTLDVHTLTRHKVGGLAPYVGEPFAYTWWALVDELGRAVAGDSWIVHHRYDSWMHAPGGVWPDPYAVPLVDEFT